MQNGISPLLKLILLSPLFLSVACSDSDSSKKKEETGFVAMPFKLKVSKEAHTPKLSSLQKSILNQINNSQKVKYEDLTAALIESHARDYALEEDTKAASVVRTFQKQIDTLVASLEDNSPLIRIKGQYEQTIETDLDKKIIYDPTSYAAPYFTNKAEMQCFSGTALNQAVTRSYFSMEAFETQKMVVINEPGHVLPGYLKTEADGTTHLYGIETTATGDAIVEYGDINKYNDCVKLTDPHIYALLVAFRDLLSNGQEVTKYNDELLAKKHKVDLDRLKPICEKKVIQIAQRTNLWSEAGQTKRKGWGTFSSIPGPPIKPLRQERNPVMNKIKSGHAKHGQNNLSQFGSPRPLDLDILKMPLDKKGPLSASGRDSQIFVDSMDKNDQVYDQIESLYRKVILQEEEHLNSQFMSLSGWQHSRLELAKKAISAIIQIENLKRQIRKVDIPEEFSRKGKLQPKQDLSITEKKLKLKEIVHRYDTPIGNEKRFPEELSDILTSALFKNDPLSFRLPNGLKISFVPIKTGKNEVRTDIVQVGFQTKKHFLNHACEQRLDGFYQILVLETQPNIFKLTLRSIDFEVFKPLQSLANQTGNLFTALDSSTLTFKDSLGQIMEVEKVFPLYLQFNPSENRRAGDYEKITGNYKQDRIKAGEEFTLLTSDRQTRLQDESYYEYKCDPSQAEVFSAKISQLMASTLTYENYTRYKGYLAKLTPELQKLEAGELSPSPESGLRFKETFMAIVKEMEAGLIQKSLILKKASEHPNSIQFSEDQLNTLRIKAFEQKDFDCNNKSGTAAEDLDDLSQSYAKLAAGFIQGRLFAVEENPDYYTVPCAKKLATHFTTTDYLYVKELLEATTALEEALR